LRTVARLAQHWNYLGGPVEEYTRLRGVIAEHCASFGRDPGEIMTSAHLRFDPSDPKAVAAEAEAFAAAGLDLGIVYMPPPHAW
jgi:alkanesulfonate monooxygenase SsuD/methylene tetrahydromethanopterin reductase-like flavin-dependent oxidoreductase (luciferase family)